VTTLPRTRDQFDVWCPTCSIRQTFGYCQGRWNSPQGLRGCRQPWRLEDRVQNLSLQTAVWFLAMRCGGAVTKACRFIFSQHELLLQYFHEEQLLNLWAHLGYLCCVVPSTVHNNPRSLKAALMFRYATFKGLLNSRWTSQSKRRARMASKVDLPLVKPDCWGLCVLSRSGCMRAKITWAKTFPVADRSVIGWYLETQILGLCPCTVWQ